MSSIGLYVLGQSEDHDVEIIREGREIPDDSMEEILNNTTEAVLDKTSAVIYDKMPIVFATTVTDRRCEVPLSLGIQHGVGST